jgi:hypothetical protein
VNRITNRLIAPLTLVASAVILQTNSLSQTVANESFSERPLSAGIPAATVTDPDWNTEWSGSGASSGYFSIVDPVPDLEYTVSGGGSILGGSRALMITTAPEPVPVSLSVSREFDYPLTTTYFRFLLRVPNSGTGTDQVEINMHAGSSVFHTFRFNPQNPTPPVGRLFFLFGGGGFGYSLSGTSTTTHLIVFMSGSDGSYAYWIDPAYGSFNSPKRQEGGSGTGPRFDKISVGVSSTDGGGPTTTVLLDEFRIGYTWADVVAPPVTAPLVPNLTIDTASRISWQSINGKAYQVQYSYNLTDWFNYGSTVTGNGQVMQVFDSRDSSNAKYYRVAIP